MSTTVSTLLFLAQNLIIYIGIPLLILGLIGGLFNIIVFLSLKTFRQSPCAFYLTIMSLTNIGQLITGLLSRLVINITGTNWTLISVFYCKFRWYCIDVCALISFTCISLATIDQFLATSSKPQWQQYSNIKLSRSLCVIFILIWLPFESPTLIFYNHVISPTTGLIRCVSTNPIHQKYITFGLILTFIGVLPILITISFGFLAYRNVRQIPYRTVPLVRRELDKQLTVMVLVQVIFNFFTVVPNTVVSVYTQTVRPSNNPVIAAQTQLISTIATCLYYLYFAVNINRISSLNILFVYCLVSVLYLYLYIETISSAIDLCTFEKISPTGKSSRTNWKSNSIIIICMSKL
jgi:hypothetical protein